MGSRTDHPFDPTGAAEGSSGSSYNQMDFSSPSPPSSANVSSTSSGHLPENVHLSMPAMPAGPSSSSSYKGKQPEYAKKKDSSSKLGRGQSRSADRSRANLPLHRISYQRTELAAQVPAMPPQESAAVGTSEGVAQGVSERQRRRILAAYNNQFAHVLGKPMTSVSSGSSPPVSLISGSSFNSPRTITLEDMMRASRQTPRATAATGMVASKGKWSQRTTPTPTPQQQAAKDDRDSGLFGGQAFTFTSPANPNTSSGSFGPIQEEESNDDGYSDDNYSDKARLLHAQNSPKPKKYDVRVPPPESLARTPTLATRSPTPTSMARQQAIGRRRRATTTSTAADSGIRVQSSLETSTDDSRNRSRSFGGNSSSSLSVPLIPPPPEESAQFRNPFIGSDWPPAQSHEQQHAESIIAAEDASSLPEYLYERESDRESATHTRIRHRKHRNPSSVASAMSPAYTVNSTYSPSNAGSNLTYELTYLGMHRTADSPLPPPPGMVSQIISEPLSGSILNDSSAVHRRRSMSLASSGIITGGRRGGGGAQGGAETADEGVMTASSSSGSDGSSSRRRSGRPFRHTRSESTGSSSRVSSIREEFEERARQHAAGVRSGATPIPPLPASVTSAIAAAGGSGSTALTPKSKKVARIRERIEEWQLRTEATESMNMPSGHSNSNSSHSRPGSSATSTAMGAQIDIGEIEAVRSTAGGASDQPHQQEATTSSPHRLVPLTPGAIGQPSRGTGTQGSFTPKGKEVATVSQVERVQTLDRSNTRASRESKYSADTAQSSNIPPSLYGSDKSVFSTPLLTGLPYMSVPSDIASLRTTHTATLSRPAETFSEEVPTEGSGQVSALSRRGDHEKQQQQQQRVGTGSSTSSSGVLGAVASPVSIGGHKKQSLVVDARSASSEMLQGTQEVRAVSPEIHRVSPSMKASRVSLDARLSAIGASGILHTKEVLESPAVDVPSATSAGERRAWARRRPDNRPPLTAIGDSAESTAGESTSTTSATVSSADVQAWDERMRLRHTDAAPQHQSAVDSLRFKPLVADSPALAVEPKTSGGVDEAIGSMYRIDRIDSALATLEGGAPRTGSSSKHRSPRQKRHRKARQNRDSGSAGLGSPVISAESSSPEVSSFGQQEQQHQHQQLSTTSSSLPFAPAGDEDHQPVSAQSSSSSNGARPLSQQRMGRHGSSPLNPFTGAPITAVPGTIAPPLPQGPASHETGGGILQRITGTVRRNKRPPPTDNSNVVAAAPMEGVVPVAPTPLPRRWWRNIKESMYAPIPPLHIDQKPDVPARLQQSASARTDQQQQQQQPVDVLSSRPVRRHSFSGSTDIEQHRITAALSPRENVRRKETMLDRVRGMLRGGKQQRLLPASNMLPPPLPPSDPSSFVAGVAAPPTANTAQDGYSLKIPQSIQPPQSTWASTNPFLGAQTPLHRRASFDTLSVHEMAEVDRQELHSRLNNLISPHVTTSNRPQPAADDGRLNSQLDTQHSSLAASPKLPFGSIAGASSSKFSFETPSTVSSGGGSSKPLPLTPKRRSHADTANNNNTGVFTFSQQLPQPEMVQQQHSVKASPIFGSNLDNGHAQQTGGSSASRPASQHPQMVTTSVVEMAERPKPLPQKPQTPSAGMSSSAMAMAPGAGSHDIRVNTTTFTPPVVPTDTKSSANLEGLEGQSPVRKRPSLLKRLTSGWRKPDARVSRPAGAGALEPIAEEEYQHQQHQQPMFASEGHAPHGGGTALAHGAVEAAGAAMATGIFGKLFRPSTEAAGPELQGRPPLIHSRTDPIAGSHAGLVPNVNVVASPTGHPNQPSSVSHSPDAFGAGPQPYPPPAAVASLAQMPGFPHTQQQQQQQQQQHSSGSTYPTIAGTNNLPHQQQQQLSGSMVHTPMPGQTFPGNASLPPMQIQQQQQLMQQQMPMSAPPHQMHQQHGMGHPIPGSAPPGQQHTLEPAPGTSKLMTTLASIPLVGSLFGNKKQKQDLQLPPMQQQQQQRPQRMQSYPGSITPTHGGGGGGRPSRPSSSSYYTRPTTSYTTSSAMNYHHGHQSGSPPQQQAGGLGGLLSRLKGSFSWYQVPLVTYLFRESALAEMKPLIGRYALQYPLVETTETAAARAATTLAQRAGAGVRAGGLRALDVKEFRHAAPGLRYNTLDNRLETAFVPRFSRLPKYRRAAEVWDDDEALQIAQRVTDRMSGAKQSPFVLSGQQPRLRGGGGGGGTSRFAHVRDPYVHPRDVETGELARVDGHQGSGERGIAEGPGPSGMLADRIGAYVAGFFGKTRGGTVGSGSIRQQPSRVNASAYGLSRIEDPEEDENDDNASELRSLRREPSVVNARGIGSEQQPDQQQRGLFSGLKQRLFGEQQQPAVNNSSSAQQQQQQQEVPTETAAAVAVTAAAIDAHDQTDQRIHPPTPVPAAQPPPFLQGQPQQQQQQQHGYGESSAAAPRMFPPFSHLPERLVDHLMHRVGEPRVFVGSANSQIVAPNNSALPGGAYNPFDEDGGNPYRTGTEWNFAESVRFSSPYPTTLRQVRNTTALSNANSGKKVLIFRPRSSEIARWIPHIETMRDFCQIIALVLGTCGYVRAPLDSSVGARWPWIIVSGIPATVGLLWPELSTTTGASIGFFVFFAAVTIFVLLLWTYGLYIERPSTAKAMATAAKSAEKEKKRMKDQEIDEETELITYQEEVVVAPNRLDFIGRIFRQMPRRRRMHILFSILATLYIPMTKLCLDAIVWSQGYWAVPNPYRTTDKPAFGSPSDGMRSPSAFCYTTSMRQGSFNGAFVILPFAVVLFLWLSIGLPFQVHQLVRHSIPRVPGWMDGRTPGHKLPPASGRVSAAPTTIGAATAPNSRAAARDVATQDIRTRDDPNPMVAANELLQGIQASGLVGSQHMAYLAALQGLIYAANTGPGKQVGSGVADMFGGAWKRLQDIWTGNSAGNSQEDDPYWGMEKDEAYQARLRDMKQSHRNRHLATVQYRRALDADTCDYRFLYSAQYPVHAGDQARLLLWKLMVVVASVVLSKDNCWTRAHARRALDIGRCSMLLLVLLLMLRSHHSHRPFFDPTANLGGLFVRLWFVVVVIVAFPLFLLSDPMSQTHAGLCVALFVGGFTVLLGLLTLAAGSMPRIQVVFRGRAATSLTLSPGILVATSAYDPRLRRLLIERVWQDTWSAILLASRDFRLLPNHRICFCRTRVHPPYMVNYIGFAAERHLENLHLYDAIGRSAYSQAVLWERQHEERAALVQEIAQRFTGPDMYFNPYAPANNSHPSAGGGSMAANALDTAGARFRVGPRDVKSWFGKVYILHFPFMVCMVYDELPDVIVPIAEEQDLRLFMAQNAADPVVAEKRDARRKLRAMDGQYVTLTYIEHSGPNGSHLRYCLPLYAEENEQYLAQYAGRRRVIYRGILRIHQHGTQMWDALCNVTPGFTCALQLTEEVYVDNEEDVNNLDREQNPFRMQFWRNGVAGTLPRSGISQRSRDTLGLNDHNRHLLGVTVTFEMNADLRALFDENADTIDPRLPMVNQALARYQDQCFAEFARKRTGLTPSFHIDVFAPGPESYHVTHLSNNNTMDTVNNSGSQEHRPIVPATPTMDGPSGAVGLWHNDMHGRLSYLPTLTQLADRLDRLEENPYMRNLLTDHRDDITLLYERLRTLVPSESNDPVKFAWYLFWDDLYRRYATQVKEFKKYDTDFNPLYSNALPYYPLPRARLERFLLERGLWKPVSKKTLFAGNYPQQAPPPNLGKEKSSDSILTKLKSWVTGVETDRDARLRRRNEFAMDLLPAPNYVPGVTSQGAGGAHLWRAGDDDYLFDSGSGSGFVAGAEASGFIHSGLLNRLYAWLDIIAYGVDR
ncbi:hypothetical protein LPJ74_005205 [Coemansia sp. RSA 1843]|nr:hypothetical protein LPJ74_005205 [Coemansia sp. RSA 1843]